LGNFGWTRIFGKELDGIWGKPLFLQKPHYQVKAKGLGWSLLLSFLKVEKRLKSIGWEGL